jgi:hypothetical protein
MRVGSAAVSKAAHASATRELNVDGSWGNIEWEWEGEPIARGTVQYRQMRTFAFDASPVQAE